jgi:hypothetical protein
MTDDSGNCYTAEVDEFGELPAHLKDSAQLLASLENL